MRIMSTTTMAAVTLTAAAIVGACSDHEAENASGRYCTELRSDKAYFQSLKGPEPDLGRLDQAFTKMHVLAASAPPAVGQDWSSLDQAVTTIEDAFDDAGLDAADLVAMQDGEVPADVDLEKLSALAPKMEALSGPRVDTAAAHIAEHAHDECGVDLTS